MPYYEGHDYAYQKLEADGASCWDRVEYEKFCTRPFLEAALTKISFDAARPKALELGCGTGPATCFLAARGFEAEGIDISETAVRMAAAQAKARCLDARFRVGDVCFLEGVPEYDLILDGHCLHCIVHDAERRALLQGVHRLLKPGGVFLAETMVHCESMRFPDAFILDGDGVLWVKVRREHKYGAIQMGDVWCQPNRRIKKTEQVADEIRQAGFVLEWSAEVQQEPPDPAEFQAIARK